MATRKPASVLPDPVGAAISVSAPEAMSGHPWAWGSDGPSGNRRSNHVRTAGWKSASPRGAAAVLADAGSRGALGSLVSGNTITSIVPGGYDSLARSRGNAHALKRGGGDADQEGGSCPRPLFGGRPAPGGPQASRRNSTVCREDAHRVERPDGPPLAAAGVARRFPEDPPTPLVPL